MLLDDTRASECGKHDLHLNRELFNQMSRTILGCLSKLLSTECYWIVSSQLSGWTWKNPRNPNELEELLVKTLYSPSTFQIIRSLFESACRFTFGLNHNFVFFIVLIILSQAHEPECSQMIQWIRLASTMIDYGHRRNSVRIRYCIGDLPLKGVWAV